jgi:hypothetical protein
MSYTGGFMAGEFEGVGTFQSAQFCVKDGTFKGGKLHGINVRNILVNYRVRGNGTLAKVAKYELGSCTTEDVFVQKSRMEWTPAPPAVNCECCGRVVGLLTCHHCRACAHWHLICGTCSVTRVPVRMAVSAATPGALDAVRACKACASIASNKAM